MAITKWSLRPRRPRKAPLPGGAGLRDILRHSERKVFRLPQQGNSGRRDSVPSGPEKESPAEAGQGPSWKENQDEAYQHQQQIAAVLRLVAQQPLPGVGTDAAIGSVSEMSQQSNFKNRAVVV